MNKFIDLLMTCLLIFCLLIMPVFTFGYDAVHLQNCTEIRKPVECDRGMRTFAGLTAAVTWPLYWSWTLQEKK